MKVDIILAGVGGQGILSIATVIGIAALDNKLFVKQSEVHGMSQRGGAVQSHLRISEHEIASDLIPLGCADIILSVEPMESLRYLPYLSKDGWLVTNTTPFINITDYPDFGEVLGEINSLPHQIALDADKIAKEIKSPRSSNIVMLGAASPFLNIPLEIIEGGIKKVFTKKGEKVVQSNLEALIAGRIYTQENIVK